MSQPFQGDCAAKQYKVPNLSFAQDTCFNGQQKLYVVVALSQQKQTQIMKTVGQVHCHNQPFPTWSLLGQALSKALFTELGRLKLKSTMELHQKDYLLFEQDSVGEFVNTSDTAKATESILEVDFGKLDDSKWLGYWKIARPAVVWLVQNTLKDLAQLNQSSSPQPDQKYQDVNTNAHGTTDGISRDLHEDAEKSL